VLRGTGYLSDSLSLSHFSGTYGVLSVFSVNSLWSGTCETFYSDIEWRSRGVENSKGRCAVLFASTARTTHRAAPGNTPKVVVIGGGFGGLNAVKTLAKQPVRVTLIDRWNHHLFQPLLYQVATGALPPSDIASPLRSILRRQENAEVILAEVTAVDLNTRTVQLADGAMTYDYLILSAGARNSYFGHDAWQSLAPGLKSIDDAVEVRRRVFLAFEEAEREKDPNVRKRLLIFVIVGVARRGWNLPVRLPRSPMNRSQQSIA